MESDSALKADKSARVGDNGFQTGKILALSIAHFVHDVYSSFNEFLYDRRGVGQNRRTLGGRGCGFSFWPGKFLSGNDFWPALISLAVF